MPDPHTIVAKQQAVVDEAMAVGTIPAVVAKAQAALAEAQAFAGGSTLPAYVPPVGKFAEFTLNKPTDCAPGYFNLYSFLTHWTGGALVKDYSPHGGLAYFGGREHTGYKDYGGVLVLNIESRTYEMRCLPDLPAAEPYHWSPIWIGSSGPTTLCTVTGTTVQFQTPVSGLKRVILPWATNAEGNIFEVVSSTSNSVILDREPQGITNPTQWGGFGGARTDDWGDMEPDSYPSKTHTYNGLQEMPAAWGGGPRGALALVSHSGGFTDEATYYTTNQGERQVQGIEGFAGTYKFDLSQAKAGVTRITGTNKYVYATDGVTPAHTNDGPCTCADYLRQGWWSRERMGSYPQYTSRTCFTSKDGQITSYADTLQTSRAIMHHFDDEDLLCIISGYNSTNFTFGVWVRKPHDVQPSGSWTKVQQAGLEAAVAPLSVPVNHDAAIGYMGMRWCSHLNYQCFIGFPGWIRVDDTHVKLLLLTPPPVGQRLTGTWQWSSEVIESHDGSIMRVNITNPDHGVQNGSFGKLVYCDPLKSLVWTRRIDQKGQLIRLARMH